MNKPVLVIMAAGMGSRYGGLKQAEKVSPEGDMLIDFSLFNAKKAGFEKAILIIREEHRDIFSSLVDERAGKHMEIEYVYQKMDDLPSNGYIPAHRMYHDAPEGKEYVLEERKKPWGTAHAIYACRNVIDGPFAVINADDYYGPASFRLAYQACLNNEPALIGYKVKNTITENGLVTRGVCREENGILTGIVEQKNVGTSDGIIGYSDGDSWIPLDPETLVSMNFWAFPKQWIDILPKKFEAFFRDDVPKNPEKAEFLIPEVVGETVKNEGYRVRVLSCDEKWFGVTYKEDKEWVVEEIAKMKENGDYPKILC